MKPEQFFIGDIKKCTKYEYHPTFKSEFFINGCSLGCDSFGTIEEDSFLYKKNAILVKIENGGYVDLDRFNSILDHIRIHNCITKDGYKLGGLMMGTSSYERDCLFVDENSLKPYYSDAQQKDISVRKFKKMLKKSK